MNIYIYPYCTDEICTIKKVKARNYQECEDKIVEYYCNKYEDLSDSLDFDKFIAKLYDDYGITIGNIYDLSEFE